MRSAVKVIWRRRYERHGYELRRELCECPDGTFLEILSAYTLTGHYIGDPGAARHLCVRRGIRPEPRVPGNHVCSVGKDKRGRWWGWSHRAISSFATRRAAARFAESVS